MNSESDINWRKRCCFFHSQRFQKKKKIFFCFCIFRRYIRQMYWARFISAYSTMYTFTIIRWCCWTKCICMFNRKKNSNQLEPVSVCFHSILSICGSNNLIRQPEIRNSCRMYENYATMFLESDSWSDACLDYNNGHWLHCSDSNMSRNVGECSYTRSDHSGKIPTAFYT